MTKLCRDCKWFGKYGTCNHPKAIDKKGKLDLVFGEKTPDTFYSAGFMRHNRIKLTLFYWFSRGCGIKARYYEPN